ncbi:MAG: stage II sporulation protein D [Ruminococcaceae bacterium]|nr:stage II sporulation protein D [Oscillospiraceae bacterium]
MKNLYGYLSVFLGLVLLLFPLIPGKADSVSANTIPQENIAETEMFFVKNNKTGEITKLSAENYVIGVVSAEMPALYHDEALKAQAVAAYTFARFRKEENRDKDFDITDDFTTDQAYLSDTELKEKWGEKYDEYLSKIKNAVKSVEGELVTYDKKPALTVYTAISAGKTESAKNVWGKDISYLVPVESIGDLLSPDYLSEETLTKEQIIEKMPELKDIPHTKWFSSPKYSDSGTLLSATFGETVKSGSDLRNALGLKSAAFEVKFENEAFVFSVKGYGHLAGMSQYGANYMAQQGSTYKEILKWYYKGCEIS